MPENMRRLVVFFCAVGLVAAQDSAPAKDKDAKGQDKEDRPLTITTRVVLAPVTVVDRNNDFVPGLTPYDFRLYDNGKLQNITQDMATHPLSVVVVIQSNADVEKMLPYIKRLSSVF